MRETIVITKEEYLSLKKKASFAEDLLVQLEGSLKDIEHGRIKKATH